MPRGQAALIVFQHRDLERCTSALRRAGVPTLQLEHYEGRRTTSIVGDDSP